MRFPKIIKATITESSSKTVFEPHEKSRPEWLFEAFCKNFDRFCDVQKKKGEKLPLGLCIKNEPMVSLRNIFFRKKVKQHGPWGNRLQSEFVRGANEK